MLPPAAELDQWTPIGPSWIDAGNGATGVLFHIAIVPGDAATLYVSSPTSGVWASQDGGSTWADASSNLPSFAVAGLAVDGAGTLYAAIADSGIYRSVDGGASWSLAGGLPSAVPSITDLVADPVNAGVLHLMTSAGVYRSVDRGTSWQVSMTSPGTSLVMAPGNVDVLYAGVPDVGVMRTQDGGASGPAGWAVLTPGLGAGTIDVRVSPSAADPATVYARLRTGSDHNVYATADSGVTWELRSTVTDYTSLIAADVTDAARVYRAGVDFWRSDDGGRTWTMKTGAHVDHHAVAADPTAPGAIYTACDGGLYRSVAGDGWVFRGEGLVNTEFYDLAISVTQPDLAIGGTQDNGTLRTDGSDMVWTEINGGDGGTVAIDPTDASVIYAMNQGADSIVRSTDGGQSFENIAAGLPPGPACFNLHFQTHPVDTAILLACCGSLWTTRMPTVNWTKMLTPPGAPSEVVMKCTVGRDNWYYAATNTGRLYLADGGANWELGFVHPSATGIVDLIVDDGDPTILFGAFGGSSERVFRFQRRPGLTLVNEPVRGIAEELSLGLLRGIGGVLGPLAAQDLQGPPATVPALRTLAIDAMRPDTLYVGSASGVSRARSLDGGATWQWADYSAGLARADVRALRVQPATGVMRAATFGRSAYQVLTDYPVGSIIITRVASPSCGRTTSARGSAAPRTSLTSRSSSSSRRCRG